MDKTARTAPNSNSERKCLIEIIKEHIEIINDKSTGLSKAEESAMLARHYKFILSPRQAVRKLL